MKKSILKEYAKLIVKVGANVQKGQDVIIQASVEEAYFVPYVVEAAYKAKAKYVSVDWSSTELTKLNYKYASTKTLSHLPDWKVEKWNTLPKRYRLIFIWYRTIRTDLPVLIKRKCWMSNKPSVPFG